MVHFDAECADDDGEQHQGKRRDCCQRANGDFFENAISEFQPKRPDPVSTDEALDLTEEVYAQAEKMGGGNITLHDVILGAAAVGIFRSYKEDSLAAWDNYTLSLSQGQAFRSVKERDFRDSGRDFED